MPESAPKLSFSELGPAAAVALFEAFLNPSSLDRRTAERPKKRRVAGPEPRAPEPRADEGGRR